MAQKGIVKDKNWTLRESQIVLLLLGGNTREEVAKIFDLSPNRIGQINNSPMAKEIREDFKKRAKELTLNAVEDRLNLLAKKSVDKLDETLSAKIPATSKAKPNQDRVAIKILEGRNYLRKNGDGGKKQGGGPLFSPEGEARFLDMLEKANSVKNIDPFDEPPIIEVEAIETNG